LAGRIFAQGGRTVHTIMLLNPKGGSGKTTIATNLAAYYAGQGFLTALFDHDAQGSSTRWLQLRPESRAVTDSPRRMGVTSMASLARSRPNPLS